MTEWMNRPVNDPSFSKLIIPAQNVACVEDANSAEHALLVLIKSRYSSIPVLSRKNQVVGTISKTIILDHVLGLERIEVERLSTIQVGQIMSKEIHEIRLEDSLRKAIQLAIQTPYLCIVQNGLFHGLVTRRALLAYIIEQTKVPAPTRSAEKV
ncbi:CBS domain-containing protein [Alicyclobacillus sp. TC]|uniref:CBS domain-containing protein n=2 Tax=Alicyclobacillus tolerans TaxID=90970 RepID=A0A1M6XB92_9BACL|nr:MULTISPECIES: cyclic-di-AMP-binding protein CbpB [Alicyclobacillus]MDP9728105.1 putative transcriptional regulator [Alicyclobacillus tengchongensis]QRF23335.1 CBS domain-containing protein [Alicyclobacillus sp. TC]SHL03216.1 CBS domain-containing protein [Alicyclobacillus montanus]